jgi:hypothetical protein
VCIGVEALLSVAAAPDASKSTHARNCTIEEPTTLDARAESDADLHVEGDGNTTWGTKFVVVATRTKTCTAASISAPNGSPSPTPPSPRAASTTSPLLAGAQGVVYEAAPLHPPPTPARFDRPCVRRSEAPAQPTDSTAGVGATGGGHAGA